MYGCFVDASILENRGLVIICKDGNNFNIRASNLMSVSLSERQQRTIKRKRFRSPLLDIPEEARIRQRQALAKKHSKQVSQYTREGKK